MWQIGFRVIKEDLIDESQRLSDIIDNSRGDSEFIPTGIIDGATKSKSFTQAIISYKIGDLNNFEIYEKLIKVHNKLQCNEVSNENIIDESIWFTNSDLCTKNIEGSTKDQICKLHHEF